MLCAAVQMQSRCCHVMLNSVPMWCSRDCKISPVKALHEIKLHGTEMSMLVPCGVFTSKERKKMNTERTSLVIKKLQ